MSTLSQKIIASMVNCTIILVLSLPFYVLLPSVYWKLTTIGLCLIFHMIFRRTCLGMSLAGTKYNVRPTLLYVVLYSLSFSVLLFWVWVPFDLLACYVVAQVLCIRKTGNTIPGWLTGIRTLSNENQT